MLSRDRIGSQVEAIKAVCMFVAFDTRSRYLIFGESGVDYLEPSGLRRSLHRGSTLISLHTITGMCA
jgi:hypothetical protein